MSSAHPLAKIFQTSIDTNNVFTQCREAFIEAPILKKDDKHSLANYCPVSLICMLPNLWTYNSKVSHGASWVPQHSKLKWPAAWLQALPFLWDATVNVHRWIGKQYVWWGTNKCSSHGFFKGLWCCPTWMATVLWHQRFYPKNGLDLFYLIGASR